MRAQAVSHALASPWSAAAKRSATTLKEVYPRAALVFLHNSINRSTCAPFELRRPLLAFRSARQQRTASHRYQRITLLISQNGMTAGSCQRARSASGSLYGSRTWKRPLERWSSVNTRPELAEAARRLRQLSHSQRAQLSMRGSQSVRSLRIGFSWARALLWWNARAASAAHRQLSIDGLARSLTARDRGFALGSSRPACSSPAATQRPHHRRLPTHPLMGLS